MTINDLDKLAALVKQERRRYCSRGGDNRCGNCRPRGSLTSRRSTITSLDCLTNWLRHSNRSSDQTLPEALHAERRVLPRTACSVVQDAFDIEEVVAEYNILRGCIHDLADVIGMNLQGKPFHIVNRVLDHAIGAALQTYATQRAPGGPPDRRGASWPLPGARPPQERRSTAMTDGRSASSSAIDLPSQAAAPDSATWSKSPCVLHPRDRTRTDRVGIALNEALLNASSTATWSSTRTFARRSICGPSARRGDDRPP